MSGDNFERLDQLLGQPATKRTPLSSVVADALKELKEEQALAAKEEAKKVLTEATQIARQFQTAVRQLEGEKKKFNKQLGQLLGKLGGKPQQPEGEQQGDEESQEPATE